VIPHEELDAEVERFRKAVEMAKEEIRSLGRTVAEKLDANQAAIFDAHLFMLEDPLLIDRTIDRIYETGRNVEYIFWNVTKEIGDQLQALGDAYFNERTHDLYDVARRVLKFVRHLHNPDATTIRPGSIIVANDLGPSETAQFHRESIAGLCTNSGGPTSHTAILAKALSLPAVVGLDYLTHYVRTGDMLIIDGADGKVILHPTEDQLAYYRERLSEEARERESLSALRPLPAHTLDGVDIRLEANIEFSNEIEYAREQGAEGIGLYRTEYFFIDRPALPSEDEQLADYLQVITAMEGAPVVFRTLDIGGDKLSACIATLSEANPFLGLRAIRLCLAHPELLRCQLRPMLRAAAGRVLHLLLPMISGVDEVRQTRRHLEAVRAQLAEQGHALPAEIRVGAMIEIPSAAIQADILAREVDFFSIGTNDLIQYTLAVDRVNKQVGHLYQDSHPAVLHLIHQVADSARRHGIPVTVCGEMAGDPRMALLLIGLGVRTLSMSPALIPRVKRAIRSVRCSDIEALARRLLQLATPTEVREELLNQLFGILGAVDSREILRLSREQI
jgi:phosphotransferase system enzyme I (PtsI)